MSNKLCISTIVNKAYQKYIPIFLYFCLKSYPEYSIKLFLTEGLNNKYISIISELNKLGIIEIKENCFEGYPKVGHELKTLRWMLNSNDFDKYDYIYIGDVDILICREDESLLEQHLNHCIKTKLPYSNSVRPNSKRLSGLHFIKKHEYYSKMDGIVQKHRGKLKNRELINAKNEETLYKMVVESGFSLPEGWFRPHHGLHLGIWRKRRDPKTLENFLIKNDEYKYNEYYEYYKSFKKDDLFNEIYNNRLEELINMEYYFESKKEPRDGDK